MEQISCYSGQIGLMADENANRLGLQIRTSISNDTRLLNDPANSHHDFTLCMLLRGEQRLTLLFTLKQLPLSQYFFKCLRCLPSRKMLTVYDTSDLKALPLVFQFVAKTTGQRVCERLALCLEIRDRSSIT